METIALENFTEGMTADIRDESPGVVKLVKHFDLLTRPKSLTPYHSQISGDDNSVVNRIRDFIYYNGAIYGKGGSDTAGTLNTFVSKQTDFTSPTWTQTANFAANVTSISGVFVEYHDFMYGICSGASVGQGYIFKYDPSGVAVFDTDNAGGAIASTSNLNTKIANGIVHSKDDILYMAVKNIVISNNNGSWNKAALTLPSKYVITAMCEYGNYLAIGCSPYASVGNAVGSYLPGGKSVVYLWDRDSTVNTLSEVIDFGIGNLTVLDQVEGELVGVLVRQDIFSNLSTKLVVKRYAGASLLPIGELLASSTTGLQLLQGRKFNSSCLYFPAGIEIDGTVHTGIWAVGKNQRGHWAIWFDTLPNNDTAITNLGLAGFFKLGDFTYISHITTPNSGGYGTGYNLTMTSNSATAYAGSSIIETVINPDMTGKLAAHRTANKQLLIVAVATDPIPANGQFILKYKIDGSAWTTIITQTTAGQVVTEMPITESGVEFTSGREYQFRIESTGGVVPTALKYKYEVLDTLI